MSKACCAVMLSLVAAASLPAGAETVYRDPMRPYEPRAGTGNRAETIRYRLSTILISSSRRVAVINGQICREGDRVDGAEVIAIELRSVRLRAGSANLTVALASRVPQETGEEVAP